VRLWADTYVKSSALVVRWVDGSTDRPDWRRIAWPSGTNAPPSARGRCNSSSRGRTWYFVKSATRRPRVPLVPPPLLRLGLRASTSEFRGFSCCFGAFPRSYPQVYRVNISGAYQLCVRSVRKGCSLVNVRLSWWFAATVLRTPRAKFVLPYACRAQCPTRCWKSQGAGGDRKHRRCGRSYGSGGSVSPVGIPRSEARDLHVGALACVLLISSFHPGPLR
jgi:hypothetical protein